LPLVPATAPLFPAIDVLGIGSAEAAAGLVITLGGCHRHERADLGYVPTIGHGQRPGHFLLQLLDALLNGSVIGSVVSRAVERDHTPTGEDFIHGLVVEHATVITLE